MAITVRHCSVEKYMRTLLSDDFDRTDIGFKPMILTLGHDFYLLNTVVQEVSNVFSFWPMPHCYC